MKAISLKIIHSLAHRSEYYDFENDIHELLYGTLATEAKEEMFLCDADEIRKEKDLNLNK